MPLAGTIYLLNQNGNFRENSVTVKRFIHFKYKIHSVQH